MKVSELRALLRQPGPRFVYLHVNVTGGAPGFAFTTKAAALRLLKDFKADEEARAVVTDNGSVWIGG